MGETIQGFDKSVIYF